jgi:branched-chain amino acid aminotransferase
VTNVAWIDGALFEPGGPGVSPFDHALLTGDGVFETMRVSDGRPFALRRHLDRLDRSARGLGLMPPEVDAIRAGIDAVLTHLGEGPARLRVTVTGGGAALGSDRADAQPTLIVAGGPLSPWPDTAAVVTVPWVRNERSAVAGLKTVSYAENVVALAYAHERDAGEALFANTVGHLCEGTGSNVFLVIGGQVLTPPLSSGCLPGITRELIVERGWAAEADLPMVALTTADEVFLSSSTRDVQPVHCVDDRMIRAPGPHSAEIAAAFADLVANEPDP